MTKPSGELTFERALAELEKIVARMESGELSLEQALATHKRGLELARPEGEERAHPLAAFERGIAHRRMQRGRSNLRARKPARERRFHARLDAAHPGLEVAFSPHRRARRGRAPRAA